MATYYWVGGDGNWSDAANHWSNTSNGTPNVAYLPTPIDDVIFDQNSNTGTNTFTVTVDGVAGNPSFCQNFSTSGLDGAMTVSISATAQLRCYGSMTLPATNFSFSATAGASIYFMSTAAGNTITTNGVALTNIYVILQAPSSIGSYTLGSALTCNVLYPNSGTFNTGNYSITANAMTNNVSSIARTINLGSSTITLASTAGFSLLATNLTSFNAGTSQITCTSTAPTFAGAGQTFYNVTFSSTALATMSITGGNTYNNLTFAARASAGVGIVTFDAGVRNRINGTLTLGSGTTGVARLFVRSGTPGSLTTLSTDTLTAMTDIDFRDVAGTGTATWAGTRIGNCLGNSNITFAASRTVYWNSATSANWSGAVWSTSSGNTGGTTTAVPLAQDTIIINNAGLTAGNTITYNASYQIGTLDFSSRTNTVTFTTGGVASYIYGDLTYSAAVTVSGTLGMTFAKQGGTATITSSRKTFTQPVSISAPNGTVRLNGNLTLGSTLTTTFNYGTLDLTNGGTGNYVLSTGFFSSNNTNTRAITFGTGNINCTGVNGAVFNISSAVGFSYTGTPTFILSGAGTSGQTRTIYAGNTYAESQVVDLYITAGVDTISVGSVGLWIGTLNFTGFTGTFTRTLLNYVYRDLVLGSGMTYTATTPAIAFVGTVVGQQNITTNGVTINCPITFGVSTTTTTTYLLQGAITQSSAYATTLSYGTLNLNGYPLTCGIFTISGVTTKYLISGGGQINVSGNSATVITMYASYVQLVDQPTFNLTYSGSTGTRNVFFQVSATGIYPILNVTAGSDVVGTLTGTNIYSLNFTGFTGTFTPTVSVNLYGGSLTLGTGMTYTPTSLYTYFNGTASTTATITTNGVILGSHLYLEDGNQTVELGSALTLGPGNYFDLIGGNFNTNNYALTCYSITVAPSRSTSTVVTLGSSTVTITGIGTAWQVIQSSGIVSLNAGTSTINFTGTSTTVATYFGGLTYNNVNFASTALNQITLADGNNTFNNLTIASPAVPGRKTVSIAGNLIVNGTFTVSGSTYNSRMFLFAALNTPVTITANAVSSLSYVDFRVITAAGASGTWSGTNLGDCGGNTNILFDTPKNVYWSNTAGGTWSSNSWSVTSGGTPAIANFPLAQDTIFFNNAGINSGSTVTIDTSLDIGTVNFSALTNNITLDTGSSNNIDLSGNLIMSPAVATTGTSSTLFFNGKTTIVTTAGVVFSPNISFQAMSGGTVTLVDNFTTLANALVHYNGLILNNNTLTCRTLGPFYNMTTTVAFGTGSIDVTGTGTIVVNMTNANLFTYTGTPTINLNANATTGTRQIVTSGLIETTAPDFNILAGSDNVYVNGNLYIGSACRNLTYAPAFSGISTLPYGIPSLPGQFGSGFIYGNLTLSPNMTISSSGGVGPIFATTTGVKTITTNGVTITSAIGFGGQPPVNGVASSANPVVGGTWVFQDALTLNSSMTIEAGTVLLHANTTSTVQQLYTLGTDIKYLGSSSTGTQATISQASGVVATKNLVIQDSRAIGGATFKAYTTPLATIDAGNNTGWNFLQPIVARITKLGNLLLPTENEYNEVTTSTFRVTQTNIFANEINEISGITVQMSRSNTGTISIAGELNEITNITI